MLSLWYCVEGSKFDLALVTIGVFVGKICEFNFLNRMAIFGQLHYNWVAILVVTLIGIAERD